jgi:hypothetical protein
VKDPVARLLHHEGFGGDDYLGCLDGSISNTGLCEYFNVAKERMMLVD